MIKMSAAAGILILLLILFRALFLHRLPKAVMVILWEIAILRLLLPFFVSVPIPEPLADIRDLLTHEEKYEVVVGVFAEGDVAVTTDQPIEDTDYAYQAADFGKIVFSLYLLGTGMLLFGSLYLYLRDSRLFKESLPMPEQEKRRLVGQAATNEKDLKRLMKIKFRISDRTATPVTYGLLHPAVVFPKGLRLKEEKEVAFCLQHELAHIRNYDNLKKLAAHLALCIHWFNPFVWAMYFLFNRDMELLCDERVVRRNRGSRQDYALTLLAMAENRRLGFQTGMGFGKSAVKERIIAVMTCQKTTVRVVLAAILAVAGALTAFVGNDQAYAQYRLYEATTELPGAYALEDNVITQVNLAWQEEQTASAATPGTFTEYAADAVEQETAVAEEAATLTESTENMVTGLAQEFAQDGLSVEITEDDYQLYYQGEPVFFFADNQLRSEQGFSGRVCSREASPENGVTGVVTEYDENGNLTGLVHLSEEESRKYASRWQGGWK